MFIVAHIERDDADMIAADQILLLFAVPQDKREHALQLVKEIDPFFLVERQNNFAVGAGLELVAIAQLGAQRLMVVDLAVNRQNMGAIGVVQRLGAVVDVNDGQTLMREDRFIVGIHARPVRPAVTHQTRTLQRFFTQFNRIAFQIQHTKNRTHILTPELACRRCYRCLVRQPAAA